MKNKIEPEFEMNGSPKEFDRPNLRIKIPVSKEDDDSILTPAVKRITEKRSCIEIQENISIAFIICTYLLFYPFYK